MACFYNSNRDMLILKCDSCGKTVDLYKGQTDRLLKHDYMRGNGWKTYKHNKRWIDLCPECKTALEQKKRESFLMNL